jgi:bifunctional oligoribonuclease and PAP phosphatase NrnA
MRADLVGLDPIPRRYRFLIEHDTIVNAAAIAPHHFDLLVVLDTGAIDRMPAAMQAWVPQLTTLNIDHHPTNTQFADDNWVDPAASSVGEMLAVMAGEAGWRISEPAAQALWVAIVTDTGRFSFSNTRAPVMRTAARLLETGIAPERLNHRVYEESALAQIRLQGRAIDRLEVHAEGRIAMVSLAREDFAAVDATGEDADEIVEIPRRVQGALIALFLYELPGEEPRATKVSLRTVAPFDAGAFCRDMGGGGHARAAGCTLPLPLTQARTHILDLLKAFSRSP